MLETNAAYLADEQRDEVNALSAEMEAEARRRSVEFLVHITNELSGKGGSESGGPTPAPESSMTPVGDESDTETLVPSEFSPTEGRVGDPEDRGPCPYVLDGSYGGRG